MKPGEACFFPPEKTHVFLVTSERAKVLIIYAPPYEGNGAPENLMDFSFTRSRADPRSGGEAVRAIRRRILAEEGPRKAGSRPSCTRRSRTTAG
jgi:hypothetical protein